MKIVNVLACLAVVGTATAFSLSMSATPPDSSVDRRAFVRTAVAGVAVASQAAVSPAFAADEEYADFTTTESGLKFKVTKEGDGGIPQPGQTVKAHYTGWLEGFNSEKKFDSSRDRGRPFSFKAGGGQVIRGWDESVLSMKVGERRQIILPARLAYGDRGAGGVIPGGATLYFDLELLSIL
jgi:peptidylprolyl isomerase